jgi:hypothetical protein
LLSGKLIAAFLFVELFFVSVEIVENGFRRRKWR